MLFHDHNQAISDLRNATVSHSTHHPATSQKVIHHGAHNTGTIESEGMYQPITIKSYNVHKNRTIQIYRGYGIICHKEVLETAGNFKSNAELKTSRQFRYTTAIRKGT